MADVTDIAGRLETAEQQKSLSPRTLDYTKQKTAVPYPKHCVPRQTRRRPIPYWDYDTVNVILNVIEAGNRGIVAAAIGGVSYPYLRNALAAGRATCREHDLTTVEAVDEMYGDLTDTQYLSARLALQYDHCYALAEAVIYDEVKQLAKYDPHVGIKLLAVRHSNFGEKQDADDTPNIAEETQRIIGNPDAIRASLDLLAAMEPDADA